MGSEMSDFVLSLAQGAAAAAAFGLVGILLMILGFRLFDLSVPFNLNKELAEDNNVAVAIVMGSVILAIAVVVAAAIS